MKRIDGPGIADLLRSGIENIEIHKKTLNELNVFPVPDGDTGTNMTLTLKYGLEGVKDDSLGVSHVLNAFSGAAVFGARGNSGVIISQFFKGFANSAKSKDVFDVNDLVLALEDGYKQAYRAVAKPVEGTMLTVLRESSEAVTQARPQSFEELFDVLLCEARASLKRTPELLPVLKKANVVDSGASGVVYMFEGMKKHLLGEDLEEEDNGDHSHDEAVEYIDLSRFNKNTKFEYGYCVEGVIQVTQNEFDHDSFLKKLECIAESIVSSVEDDKVKLHAHVKQLAPLMELCQEYGEFLTVKIDNMTVQNMLSEPEHEQVKKFLCASRDDGSDFAVVAVATTQLMQKTFSDMGADVVILSDIAPSTQDIVDAFAMTDTKEILVFPNSPNSIFAAMQAASLCKTARVTVLNSKSAAECYCAMSFLQFDCDAADAISQANEVLSNIYSFAVYHAVKDVKYESKHIDKNDFFALNGKSLLGVDPSLNDIVLKLVNNKMEEDPREIITIFYGKSVSEAHAERIAALIREAQPLVEVSAISTEETIYDLTIVFE